MDRLDDLLVFVEVVDGGSLTAAAERLGLSPSAVSRRLTDLEERLGARLINRTTRRIALTDIGAAFCHRARSILAALDEAERLVSEMNQIPQGLLRVTAPVMFGQMHIAPLIPSFLVSFPQVTLEVILSDRPVRLVEESVDVAVRIGRLTDSSLIARRLAPLRRAVLASPAYLETHGVPDSPESLARHNCIALVSGGQRQDWLFERHGTVEAVRVSGSLQTDSYEVLRQAALAGVGLVRIATFIAAADLRAGTLVPILESLEERGNSVSALYPATRHLSPKVRAFIDHCLAVTGVPSYWRDHSLGDNDEPGSGKAAPGPLGAGD